MLVENDEKEHEEKRSRVLRQNSPKYRNTSAAAWLVKKKNTQTRVLNFPNVYMALTSFREECIHASCNSVRR